MATLGETLRSAREKKGLTPSDVAAGTRVKVQHIEALEREDFSRMAAAAYAKGFIKLYAEFVDLDAAPLIAQYNEMHAPTPEPTLVPEVAAAAPAQAEAPAALPATAARWQKWLGGMPWQRILMGVGALVILLAVVSSLSRCFYHGEQEQSAPEAPPSVEDLGLVKEPPEPYWSEAP